MKGDASNFPAGSAAPWDAGSRTDDINGDLAPRTSFSPSRKRKLSLADEQHEPKKPHSSRSSPREVSQNDCDLASTADVDARADDDDDHYYHRDDDDDASRDSSSTSKSGSRRTLYIEYWSRTDECKERKWDHLDDIAEKYGSAEDHIMDTTLKGRSSCLEPNMFPYDTPAGIEHWTLWHLKELTHSQIKQFVENWIDANAPHVECWNYDDNPERSIDIFHVHVYLQVPQGSSVLQGRDFEDLVHEMD